MASDVFLKMWLSGVVWFHGEFSKYSRHQVNTLLHVYLVYRFSLVEI